MPFTCFLFVKFNSGFLTLGIVDIWGWVIFIRDLTCGYRMFRQHPLASTHTCRLIALFSCDNQIPFSKHGQMSPGLQNHPQLEALILIVKHHNFNNGCTEQHFLKFLKGNIVAVARSLLLSPTWSLSRWPFLSPWSHSVSEEIKEEYSTTLSDIFGFCI